MSKTKKKVNLFETVYKDNIKGIVIDGSKLGATIQYYSKEFSGKRIDKTMNVVGVNYFGLSDFLLDHIKELTEEASDDLDLHQGLGESLSELLYSLEKNYKKNIQER